MRWKEELTAIEVEEVHRIPDFPMRDESYVILYDPVRDRYAFAWGPLWPDNGYAPLEDVPDGECGIHWFDTEEEARTDMQKAKECFEFESEAVLNIDDDH